jgi:hypothetical protein
MRGKIEREVVVRFSIFIHCSGGIGEVDVGRFERMGAVILYIVHRSFQLRPKRTARWHTVGGSRSGELKIRIQRPIEGFGDMR